MITEDDLGAYLDQFSPFDIPGCVPYPDPTHKELCWFAHPDFWNVYCKFGRDNRGRILKIWLWLPALGEPVVVLTGGRATHREIELLKQINRGPTNDGEQTQEL